MQDIKNMETMLTKMIEMTKKLPTRQQMAVFHATYTYAVDNLQENYGSFLEYLLCERQEIVFPYIQSLFELGKEKKGLDELLFCLQDTAANNKSFSKYIPELRSLISHTYQNRINRLFEIYDELMNFMEKNNYIFREHRFMPLEQINIFDHYSSERMYWAAEGKNDMDGSDL